MIDRKFCETLTCKYRKNNQNNKFNKIPDLKREKAKRGLEKSANFAKVVFLATLAIFAGECLTKCSCESFCFLPKLRKQFGSKIDP